jgi:hypothetical protein
LNLIGAESQEVGQPALPTHSLRLRFPAGDVDFSPSELKGFGRLVSCSLFSPMSEFFDQLAARAAAATALGAGRKAGPARAAHRAARPAARRRGGAMNAESDLGALGPGAFSIVLEIADVRVCSARRLVAVECLDRLLRAAAARKRTRPSRIAPAVREGFAAVEPRAGASVIGRDYRATAKSRIMLSSRRPSGIFIPPALSVYRIEVVEPAHA